MNMRPIIGVALLLFADLRLALADEAVETYYFDCDVPATRFSEWNRTITGEAFQIAGTIELVEPKPDEKWWPVANVYLESEDNSFQIGLRFVRAAHSPDDLQIAIRGPDASEQPNVFAASPWYKKPISFTVSLSSSGLLSVSAAGNSASLQLDKVAVQRFALSCSTAEFRFSQVSVRTDDPK